MAKKTQDKENKQEIKTLKENDLIIRKVLRTKQKRHVKEPQEKVFKNILNDFTMNYANLVVANTTKEVMKFVKENV